LAHGDVHKRLGGWVHDLQQLHDSRSIVGDGYLPTALVDELIQAAGAERRPHQVDDCIAGVDVGNQVPFALRGVGPMLEQHDLGRLRYGEDKCIAYQQSG